MRSPRFLIWHIMVAAAVVAIPMAVPSVLRARYNELAAYHQHEAESVLASDLDAFLYAVCPPFDPAAVGPRATERVTTLYENRMVEVKMVFAFRDYHLTMAQRYRHAAANPLRPLAPGPPIPPEPSKQTERKIKTIAGAIAASGIDQEENAAFGLPPNWSRQSR